STGSPLRPPRPSPRLTRCRRRPCAARARRPRGRARPPRRSDLRPSRVAAGPCGRVHRPYQCATRQRPAHTRPRADLTTTSTMTNGLVPRSLVWATTIDTLPPQRVVRRRDGYLVVRSPTNPTHYWGNLLVFDEAPAPGEGERWEALFADDFADEPRVAHRPFTWDRTDDFRGAADGEFGARGYDV